MGLLQSQAGLQELVLPSAQLAWMLLQYEQQAVEAAEGSSTSSGTRASSSRSSGSSSTSSGADGASHAAAAASRAVPQLQQLDGVPGTVLEYCFAFGAAVHAGLPTYPGALAAELCSSDEVVQLLLAHAALTVGGTHKKVAADAAGPTAGRHTSSNSNSRKSGSSSRSAAAALAAPAAGDVPASHLQLLAALSPPLHKQLGRQYRDTPTADNYGSFNMHSMDAAEQQAELVIVILFNLLSDRERAIKEGRLEGGRSTAMAAATGASSSSSSGSDHNQSSVTRTVQPAAAAAGAAQKTVIPCEQQLLLPLALTVIELLLLLPAPSQGVLPMGLQLLWKLVGAAHSSSDQSCVRNGYAFSGAHVAQAVPTAALVVGLAEPLLLQLAPAALWYINQVEAAAAAAAAVSGTAGSSSSSASTDLGGAQTVGRYLFGLVSVILGQGEHMSVICGGVAWSCRRGPYTFVTLRADFLVRPCMQLKVVR
jgi:hypothetical protein